MTMLLSKDCIFNIPAENGNSCVRVIDTRVVNHWVVLQPYKQTKRDRILYKSIRLSQGICKYDHVAIKKTVYLISLSRTAIVA